MCPIPGISGISGRAVRFDGVDDQIIIPDSPSLNPQNAVALSVWINAEDWTYSQRIVQKGNYYHQYTLTGLVDNSGLCLFISSAGSCVTDLPAVGVWHHIVGNYDGNNLQLWVDRELVAEQPASGLLTQTSDPIFIGSCYGCEDYDHFSGQIDEVIIFGRALTPSEIQQLYNFPSSINLIPSQQLLTGNRGDTIQFVETLSNNTGVTDTVQLALSGSQWPAVLSGDSVALGSGEQATFTVDVTIPADAEWEMLNTIVVTATSSVSPTVYFDTAVLKVQMSPRPPTLLYMPMIIRPPEVVPGLTGHVTMSGAPIAGIPLDLRFYNGSSYSTYASTTTGADGSYLFSGVPALLPGQNYYVRYNNDTQDDTRLATWHTADNTTYNATSLVSFAAFDIANIVLSAPEPGATVELPVTFHWIPRAASPSDSYMLELFDLSNDEPYFYTDPFLGYVSSYTLQERPGGFEKGVEYGWGIIANSPEGGFGYSYYYYRITFK